MRHDEPTRLPEGAATRATPFAIGVLALVALAACAGENLFTGPVLGGGISGPQVEITEPQANITLAVGDSVKVTASMTSSLGIVSVDFVGNLDEGGAAFTPVSFALPSPQDTTVFRYLKRSGTTAGSASIIVTATDEIGDVGADTVAIVLGG